MIEDVEGIDFCLRQCGVYVEPFQPKEEEESSMHNTVVMFSTSDHYTLKQVHLHLHPPESHLKSFDSRVSMIT